MSYINALNQGEQDQKLTVTTVARHISTGQRQVVNMRYSPAKTSPPPSTPPSLPQTLVACSLLWRSALTPSRTSPLDPEAAMHMAESCLEVEGEGQARCTQASLLAQGGKEKSKRWPDV